MRKILLIFSAFAAVAAHADDCATGYTWNTTTAQCEITCNPGYYVATAGGECVPLSIGSYYIDTAHTVAYGDVTPESVKKTCPCDADGKCGSFHWVFDDGGHNSIKHCWLFRDGIRFVGDVNQADGINTMYAYRFANSSPTHGTGHAPCYYYSGDDGSAIYSDSSSDGCVGSSTLRTCDAGYWTDTITTGDALQKHPCNPVGTGFYSPDGDLNRYPCPDGTISGGFGDAADDISDCVPYKTLHISDDVEIQMPTVPRSEHNLIILMNGVKYYGKTTTAYVYNRMHFQTETGEIYTLINPLDEFKTATSNNTPPYTYYIIP